MFVSVPATSANLGPGFDTLGLAVDLRNEIIIKPSKFLSISTQGEGAQNPKIKKNSLFLSIFNENYKRLSGRSDNFRFEFHNRIPISRGLGSSSAVIVAALSGAYMAAGTRYNKREILNQALRYEHHPDPNRTISTARSRTVLPKMYRKEETVYSLSRAAYMTALFMSESWDLLRIASKDKLHQARRMKMMPELFDVQKVALKHGALMSTLSGSGSTFFNLAYDKDADKIAQELQKRFPQFRVFTLALDNNGVTTQS